MRLETRVGVAPSALAPVRIYLGTEDAQYRAERVFFYSVEKVRDPARVYEIFLMKNLAGFSTAKWRTNFTNYRFAIPDFARCEGRAIYNDVDQIYLTDPAELFDLDMGTHGYLAVSAQDTSVMLLDCARMAQWWTRERASTLDKAELLAGPAAEPGLWGALAPEWNARDMEYVEERSKCLHFTALHTQPWQPTPEQYSYHRHPIADVWERLEREADARAYEVFGPDHPSGVFAHAAAAAREAAGRYTPPLGQAQAWLGARHPQSVLRCSFGPAAFPSANGARVLDVDFAQPTLKRRERAGFDAVIGTGLLERAPLDDVPWILDELFAAARKDVYLAVVCPPDLAKGVLRSPEWWRAQVAAAARRYTGPGWRLDIFSPAHDGKPVAAFAAPGAEEVGTPKIWVLSGDKSGDNRQLTTLAQALGWPYEVKQLKFNSLHHLPALLLDETLNSVGSSDPLEPPWPDFVFSAGKRSVPVARWIRARSGGRTRLVHLGRPWSPLEWFDLIITTPQYALPARPNVLHNTMPLNAIPAERLARAAADPHWRERLAALPPPRIAVLVGGNSSSQVLSADCARELGDQASRLAHEAKGSLLVTTSPRTPPAAVEALRAAIDAPVCFHAFGTSDHNPYDAFLALADAFVVTGDSASMLAEACSTGKPVHIFALPHRYEMVPGARAIADLARSFGARRVTYRGTPNQQDVLGRLFDRLVERGLLTPPRNIEAYHEALATRGLAKPMHGDAKAIAPTGPDDLARAVERVRELARAERRIAV